MGRANTHLTSSANVGGGEGFRLVVPPDKERRALGREDTIWSGPFVFGPGIGVMHHFTKNVRLDLKVRGLIRTPQWGAILEVGAGLQFRL